MSESKTGLINDDQPRLTARRNKVLLVDDDVIMVEAVHRMLCGHPDIELDDVTDGATALDAAIDLRPTVILQDLSMPIVDGFELVRRYRSEPLLKDVPVIVLSSSEDAAMKVKAFETGANDYLVKLPDKLELAARIRYHSQAYIHLLERDEVFHFLRESQQKLALANIELEKLSALDSLTGIANRRRFDDTLRAEWQRGQRERIPLSLLLCDIDFFKLYNDTHGHPAGDQCLIKVAAVLNSNLRRPADLAARYGGEEFTIILPDTTLAGAVMVAEACRRQVEELKLPNPKAPLGITTLSVGVASVVPSDGFSPLDLINAADQALYCAKHGGRNRVAQDNAGVPA